MPDFGSDHFKELAEEGISCVPGYVWGYAAGLLALFVIGLFVQIKHTAKGIDHGAPKARSPAQEGLIVTQQRPVQYV